MSYVAKDKDADAGASSQKIHKIRITLTSRNVKNLEKGVYQLPCDLFSRTRAGSHASLFAFRSLQRPYLPLQGQGAEG